MTKEPIIEYITCESEDWVVIKQFGNVFYEGHSVPDFIWLNLLEGFVGRDYLKTTTISDEEMEGL